MNDPLALKIEKPLGSRPASRTSRLLLVMAVETKRHWFICATGMRLKLLVQRSSRTGCQVEHQHSVGCVIHRVEGWAAQGSPELMSFLELVILLGTTCPVVKTHWEIK